jgi:hypothetical protein
MLGRLVSFHPVKVNECDYIFHWVTAPIEIRYIVLEFFLQAIPASHFIILKNHFFIFQDSNLDDIRHFSVSEQVSVTHSIFFL